MFASGTILGISYDISKWEWKLCKSKADRLTELLFDLIQLDQIQNKVLKRILGKMNAYATIFGCKFERSFIQKIHEDQSSDLKMISITTNARSQAGYWIRAIHAASVQNTIPPPFFVTSAEPIKLYGDASGGAAGGYGAAVLLPSGELIYGLGRWGPKVIQNMIGKLTLLEAFASLTALLLAPDKLRNKHVQVTIVASLFHISFNIRS